MKILLCHYMNKLQKKKKKMVYIFHNITVFTMSFMQQMQPWSNLNDTLNGCYTQWPDCEWQQEICQSLSCMINFQLVCTCPTFYTNQIDAVIISYSLLVWRQIKSNVLGCAAETMLLKQTACFTQFLSSPLKLILISCFFVPVVNLVI